MRRELLRIHEEHLLATLRSTLGRLRSPYVSTEYCITSLESALLHGAAAKGYARSLLLGFEAKRIGRLGHEQASESARTASETAARRASDLASLARMHGRLGPGVSTQCRCGDTLVTMAEFCEWTGTKPQTARSRFRRGHLAGVQVDRAIRVRGFEVCRTNKNRCAAQTGPNG